jgi:hypothetical protein
VLWTRCPWKALSKDLPPKSTVHDYFEPLELGRPLGAALQRIKRPSMNHIRFIRLKNFPDRLLETLLPDGCQGRRLGGPVSSRAGTIGTSLRRQVFAASEIRDAPDSAYRCPNLRCTAVPRLRSRPI